ncbi:hypothetical protein PTTG_01834 [Puccinia triticina 1-1 BBBD Race 1]|uniref:Uncharacterized protein n=2 Tax=Puccinia triticina TaxID=208348 RepID=A0A180H2F3_PUCT1|nr:uncharacterized protein PtA15_11A570 [Puccinia triticina]OAV98523.1 hypothetical protein PTTG_01834 [Puccinia triticina 1-1 BBBD Race 1]WAQ89878.1 hypothetical protein PtA15_11A570 [Puccinia triticina]WAR59925.1 hypothetical protein PtB15_11B566 [Puccinia triticina]
MDSSKTPLAPAATPVPKSVSSVQPVSDHPDATVTTSPATPSPVSASVAPQASSSAISSPVSYVQQTYSTNAPAPQPTTAPQPIVIPVGKIEQTVTPSSMALNPLSKVDIIHDVVTITIPTQKMGTNQNMDTMQDATYPQKYQQETGATRALPQMTLIAIAAAIICISILTGISIWTCHKKRTRRRAGTLSLPHVSDSPMPKEISSPEKSIPLQKIELSSPTNSGYTIGTTPHSAFCEEFDFGLPVLSPTHDPKSVHRYHDEVNVSVKGGYASPPTWGGAQLDRIPSCPEHLTFVPRVLLTGNLLPPRAAMAPHSAPLRFSPYGTGAIRSPPEPRSCKMSPAEASTELQKLIEQVDLRIYEDLDMDDSFNDSISSASLESLSALTGDSLPYGGNLSMPNGVPFHLPLPMPRYNYRKVTRLRPSPSIV